VEWKIVTDFRAFVEALYPFMEVMAAKLTTILFDHTCKYAMFYRSVSDKHCRLKIEDETS